MRFGSPISLLLLASIIACSSPLSGQRLDPEQVTVKIDKKVSIVDPSPETGLTHEMLGMVRHPDGTIFVSTVTQGTDSALGLLKSIDKGETWKPLQVSLPSAPDRQHLRGLGATHDGRLWLLHQTSARDLFVSSSRDGGQSWETTPVDFGRFASGAPEQTYALSHNDYNTFIEQPDGTLMFSVGLRYEKPYYKDPELSRPAIT